MELQEQQNEYSIRMRVVAKFSNTRHKFHRRRHNGIVKFALALAFIISHCPLKIRVQIHASKCCEHIESGIIC